MEIRVNFVAMHSSLRNLLAFYPRLFGPPPKEDELLPDVEEIPETSTVIVSSPARKVYVPSARSELEKTTDEISFAGV